MLNQFVVVGRLKETLNGREIVLVVNNLEKNKDGEYTNEEITIETGITLIEYIEEYCKPGDILGIKGKIKHPNKLFAEKISFLSSRKEDKEV